MALFDDILADVYTITNRPDLVAESKLGIRAATIKLHSLEMWNEDREVEQVAVTTENSMFSMAKSSLTYIPRKIEFFKKPTADVFFEEMDVTQILDRYGYKRFNTYYQAGSTYNFLTDTNDEAVIVSYYRNPVATETGYSSWIAEEYKELVAFEAAIFVFSSIGDKEQEQRIEKMAAQQLAILQINHMPTA